jgi:hypothetical protein
LILPSLRLLRYSPDAAMSFDREAFIETVVPSGTGETPSGLRS